YLGLEAAATLIRTFELQFVHGLFQTQDYARAVTVLGHKASSAEEIDRRVSLRMNRQDLLGSQDAPRVWSVMDEAALRRPVGGPRRRSPPRAPPASSKRPSANPEPATPASPGNPKPNSAQHADARGESAPVTSGTPPADGPEPPGPPDGDHPTFDTSVAHVAR